MKLAIIIGIIWILLGVIDYIWLAYDQWKTEQTKMEGEEIILVMIACIISAPLLLGFIIYCDIKKRRKRR